MWLTTVVVLIEGRPVHGDPLQLPETAGSDFRRGLALGRELGREETSVLWAAAAGFVYGLLVAAVFLWLTQ